ncbi:ADP-ribosylation factor [Auriculariales sp. MPI-PUGE-AT-0066]|nr:ADP-ribosylation factor [Auriculariales sp. MPI-PUGE-AT-0066]
MGVLASRLFADWFGPQEARIVMLGLDAAGKTTILYQLKLGEVVAAIPTIGFNVETVTRGNVSFTVWDFPGQDKIRPLWRFFLKDTLGVIFVVDSSDTERMPAVADELHYTLRDGNLPDAPVLVLANKQDLPDALSTAALVERLRLHEMRQKWFIQATTGTSGDGLFDGLDWLAKAVKNKSKSKWLPASSNQL